MKKKKKKLTVSMNKEREKHGLHLEFLQKLIHGVLFVIKLLPFQLACTKVQEELLHYPSVSVGVGIGIGGGVALTKTLKFYVKVFKTSYFLNPRMDLVCIWYNYRCWSKILLSPIHTPAHDL